MVDDTLCFHWLRQRFVEAARICEAQTRLLHLDPAREVLLARYAALASSGARPVLDAVAFAAHLRDFEPPAPEEGALRFATSEAALAWARGLS